MFRCLKENEDGYGLRSTLNIIWWFIGIDWKLNIGFILLYRYDEKRHSSDICTYNQNKVYVVFSAMGSFFLPLIVVVYVYLKISCVIAERHNKLEALNGQKLKVKTIKYIKIECEFYLNIQLQYIIIL